MDREAMTDSNSNSERSGDSFDEEESDNGLSSSGSSDSSDDEDEQQNTLEMAKISDELLKLPRGLCENYSIFQEFFSMKTWQLLSENFKTYLMNKHFPTFSQGIEDHTEKVKTVNMLFSNQILRFGQSPMAELQRNLEEGNYRPDVLKLRQSITKSRKREQRFQSCERISQMARQLFISRERLLRTTYKSSPAEFVSNMNKAPKRHHMLNLDTSISTVRARKRFSSEIKNILQFCDVSDISDEESSLEKDLKEELQKESRLNSSTDETSAIRNNPTNSEKCIYNTQFKRKHDTADEDAARVQYESKHKKLCNRNFKQYLLEHKRRKIIEPNLPEYDTMDIRLRDVYTRAQVGGNFKRIFASGKTPGRKPKSNLKATLTALPALAINSTSDTCTDISIKTEIEVNSAKYENYLHSDQTVKTVETLENTQEVQQKLHNIPHIKDSTDFKSLQVSYRKEQELPQLSVIGGNAKTYKETNSTLISSNQILQQQTTINACSEPVKKLWEKDVKPNLPITIKEETVDSSIPQESIINAALVTQSTLKANANLTASRFLIDSDNGTSKRNYSFDTEETTPKEAYSNQNDVNGGPALTKQALQSTSEPELLQETHACFFSLLRDFFCSTPNHRMKFDELREKVGVWLCNPITALNDWYSLADSWSALLTSAINFLAGDFAEQPEEYVPYIEYKSQQNIYQWIGAGRDSDARLVELFNYWLSCKNNMADTTYEQKIEANCNFNPTRRCSAENEDLNAYERGISPPPAPRCPTTWTVVAATTEEVTKFQQQERERFENPHRAYTYRMHGYESVVGPVKGIYSQILALTKARGHSMMIGDRPNFVTILTLVRDATARLPNGEGTRADISELLKCSQYINRDAAENVLQTIVSGALDRMHTEHDPCVRYDPKRKIWIYLHRNRSEEDFERMHQQYQGLGKHKKPSNRKTKPKTLKEVTDGDFVGNVNSTTGLSIATSSAYSNHIYSLPALVPANPIIVNTTYSQTVKQQQQQHQQQLAKCPPVPPLKYNIQPLQQQKSLLKTTLQPNRSFDLKPLDSNLKTGTQGGEFGATYLAHLQSNTSSSATTTTTQTTSMPSSLISFPNKSLSFAVATGNTLSNNNTTPIIVATPAGLKTVHVSNATSVSSSTTSSPTLQLVKSDARQAIHASALSATVGGKKVALNKPIIINQITQQAQIKTHKSQQPQPTKQLQKSQQQSFVIPTMHLNSSTSDQQPTLIYENDMQTTTKESGSMPTVFMDSSKICNQEAQLSQTQSQNKNIIRILPGATSSNKAVVTVPIATSAKQPAHIIGQRLIANAPTFSPQLLPKSAPGISLISNSSSSNAQQLTPGAIVRMSSQAFASLQQKQTQQHVLVKPTASIQQHRVVMGRSAINANLPHSANKNVLVQQLPATLVSASKTIAHPSGQNSNITSKCVTSVISIAPQASNSKIQTINASNLTGQQQKFLLQNLKQQSLQFKTVQVLPQQQQHQQQSQQSRLNTGGQNLAKTIIANTQAPLIKTTEHQPKTVTVSVSQPQAMAGLLKPTNSQQFISKDIKAVSKVATDLRNMNNATGQIISFEGLLAKQGGTLRVSNAKTMAKVSQASNILQLAPNMAPQDTTQYAVSSPQARNLITVGTGQQLQSTQTGSNASVFTTPISMSVGQVKETQNYMSTAAKIVASQSNAQTNIKTPHIVNTNMFGKVSSNTSAAGGFKIISSGGISTNFNIANIHGKQVILASKPAATLPATSNHAQKLQNSAIILGGQSAKLQGNANVKLISKAGTVCSQANSSHVQTVLVGNQILRIDQLPTSIKQQIQTSRISVSTASTLPLTSVANTNTGTVVVNCNETILQQPTGGNMPKTFILGSSGQKIRFQAPTTQPQQAVGTLVNKTIAATTTKNIAVKQPTSRVVLAVQGGGQIFLSPNYQGASVNLKSLQNVKVVSMAQTQSLQSHDNQHQERTQKTSPQKLTQQSILRASGSGIEKS